VARRMHASRPAMPASLVAVLVVVLAAAGCGSITVDPGVPGVPLVGTVTVTGQACPVPPEAGPVSRGTVVRVIDAEGAVVSSSALGPGETATDLAPGGCVFPFSVPGLPPEPARYTVAVGDDGRLTQQFTTEQVVNNIPVRFVV
jgi:hypothetical protein